MDNNDNIAWCPKCNDALECIKSDLGFAYECFGCQTQYKLIQDGFMPVVEFLHEWLDEHYPENIFVGLADCDKGTKFVSELRKLILPITEIK